jgi:uncharacterized coiled-coil DUF342 family protein
MIRIILSHCAIVAAMVLCAVGCSSSSRSEANLQAVQSITDVSGQIDKAKAGVDRTVSLLGQLQADGGTEKTFKDYSDSVNDLQAAGDSAAKRGTAMREKREEYLAKWQADIQAMQNPDIQKSMQERVATLRTNYDDLASKANDVREAYRVFLQDAKDVQSALKIDLTPAGVKAMDPAINKAKGTGTDLSKKLVAFNDELDEFKGKMSPQAPSTTQSTTK